MQKASGRILKSENVKVEGRFQFDAQNNIASETGTTPTPPGGARAQIVEKNSDYAIVEIICGCGQKTQIKCQY